MNCYSFGSHLLSWQISANFRSSLKADLHLSDIVRFVPRADVTMVGKDGFKSAQKSIIIHKI